MYMGSNASSKQISLTAGYERKEYLVLIFEKPTLHLCFSNCFLHLCVCVCSGRLWSRWWIWITLVAIQPQHNGLTHCLALHYGLIILHQASTMLHWVHHVSHHSTVATALLQLFGFCQIVNQLHKYVLLCCFAFVCLWHCKRAENYHLNGYGPLWPRRQSCWWDLTRIYFEPFA